jgi:hypothetical protein
MTNEEFLFSTLSAALGLIKEHQARIERLELALKTLQDCPALDWKETAAELATDLQEYDRDSSLSSESVLIAHSIDAIAARSPKA